MFRPQPLRLSNANPFLARVLASLIFLPSAGGGAYWLAVNMPGRITGKWALVVLLAVMALAFPIQLLITPRWVELRPQALWARFLWGTRELPWDRLRTVYVRGKDVAVEVIPLAPGLPVTTNWFLHFKFEGLPTLEIKVVPDQIDQAHELLELVRLERGLTFELP